MMLVYHLILHTLGKTSSYPLQWRDGPSSALTDPITFLTPDLPDGTWYRSRIVMNSFKPCQIIEVECFFADDREKHIT